MVELPPGYRRYSWPGPWNERETMTGFRLVRPIASEPEDGSAQELHSRRQDQP